MFGNKLGKRLRNKVVEKGWDQAEKKVGEKVEETG